MYDFAIKNGSVYIEGSFRKLHVYVKGTKVAALSADDFESARCIDAAGKFVLPGFIDPHVHFALGVGDRISHDDFFSGSQEAALGGVTTFIDFLDPVKTSQDIPQAFAKRMELAKKSVVDYAFHTTVANPTDCAKSMFEESLKVGINSIKLFTTYADTDRRTYDDYIYALLESSAEQGGVVVVHAENDELINHAKDIAVKDHERSRPAVCENVEVMKLAQMERACGGNLYIVHVSAGSSVALLEQNFAKELRSGKITLESCPHYFLLNSDVLAKEDGFKYTMTPPLRTEHDRGLLNHFAGSIATIGTDHCPYLLSQKNRQYTSDIPMGIGGIRYSFLNMYELFGFSVIDRFTANPAKAYGLESKGSLVPGHDADITIFDASQTTMVTDEASVYHGHSYTGAIDTVLSEGALCVQGGRLVPHTGTYIGRKSLCMTSVTL